MIISFSASVKGINTLLSKKFAWKINDLSIENLLDPVLNYTEVFIVLRSWEQDYSSNIHADHANAHSNLLYIIMIVCCIGIYPTARTGYVSMHIIMWLTRMKNIYC